MKATVIDASMLQVARRGEKIRYGIWFTDSNDVQRFRDTIVRVCGEPVKPPPGSAPATSSSAPAPSSSAPRPATTAVAPFHPPNHAVAPYKPQQEDGLSRLFAGLTTVPAGSSGGPSPQPASPLPTDPAIYHHTPTHQTPNHQTPTRTPPQQQPPQQQARSTPPPPAQGANFAPGQTVDDLLRGILGQPSGQPSPQPPAPRQQAPPTAPAQPQFTSPPPPPGPGGFPPGPPMNGAGPAGPGPNGPNGPPNGFFGPGGIPPPVVARDALADTIPPPPSGPNSRDQMKDMINALMREDRFVDDVWPGCLTKTISSIPSAHPSARLSLALLKPSSTSLCAHGFPAAHPSAFLAFPARARHLHTTSSKLEKRRMSRHTPIAGELSYSEAKLTGSELNKTRKPWDAAKPYEITQSPDPAFKLGSGMTDDPAYAAFKPDAPIKTLNLDELRGMDRYKVSSPFLIQADVTSGTENLAPFSYFMLAAHDPPTIIVSISNSPTTESGLKDSAQNIKDTREFCVSIISEAWLEAANYAAVDAPPDVSEWTLTGLTKRKSETVSVPHVAEAGVSLECELDRAETIKNDQGVVTQTVIFGRIRKAHVKESVLDPEQPSGAYKVLTEKLRPVSRLGGVSYGRSIQECEIPRGAWKTEKDRPDVQALLAKADKNKSSL
ncbi:hypothetical protein A1Q2_05135 [Trichosporon asahii var. asahii CBS 8904]|uniref:Flavin reductase like domain-containing protein n=1 Tax=Trichosporon asahii var. asahii (strain CBS 8904) TaxID=1220162 RepID=K1V8Y7_TRIAC|nr:hypothetical protein A1Q2_05135 [Trichosporon asahii var. asahii CBS 8904]